MNVKGMIRGLKNQVYQYDEGERLIRELTANDSTPPSTQNMIKLKLMLGKSFQFQTIVKMLFKRLRDFDNLRHVEKSLIVIEYLLKNAERKFVRYCQMEIKTVSKLQRYRYMLNGRDYGQLIRKRAKRISRYLEDDEKLKEARAKAQGYAMSYKYGTNPNEKKSSYTPYSNTRSSKPYTKQKTAAKSKASNLSPSKAKLMKEKKKAKKKKKVKKEKKDETLNKPMEKDEDLFAAFVGISDNNGNNNKSNNKGDDTFDDFDNNDSDNFFDEIDTSKQDNGVDDLLNSDWWQNENDKGNDNEFEWFKDDDDNDSNINTGKGDDGGQFGFGKDDDFFDDNNDDDNENKDDNDNDDDNNIENIMTNIANLENVLETTSNKPKNLKDKKGKTMAQMKTKDITPVTFDTNFIEDVYNKPKQGNSGNLFGDHVFGNNNSTQDSGFGNNNNSSFGNNNNMFGNFGNNNNNNHNNNTMFANNANYAQQKGPNQGFGGYQGFYQSKKPQANYNNNGVIPATIPPKSYAKKDADPFAQFGFK